MLNDIGTLIRQCRERKGISQMALAKKCGMVQSSISAIERGDNYPTDDNLICMAENLNAPEILTESCLSCLKRNHILKQYGKGIEINKPVSVKVVVT